MNTDERDRGTDWLEALYRDHYHHVLAYALRRVREDEADDVAAAVFLSAWQKREFVPEPALPWLYRTASHHVLHARRGEARRGRLAARAELRPARGLDERSPFEGVDEAVDARRRVEAMLARLPERDAEILRLAAWENLDPVDIATVLGISAAGARVRLHRARRRGEAILDRLELSPSGPEAPRPTSVRRGETREPPDFRESRGQREAHVAPGRSGPSTTSGRRAPTPRPAARGGRDTPSNFHPDRQEATR